MIQSNLFAFLERIANILSEALEDVYFYLETDIFDYEQWVTTIQQVEIENSGFSNTWTVTIEGQWKVFVYLDSVGYWAITRIPPEGHLSREPHVNR